MSEENVPWKIRHWPALLSLGTAIGTAGLMTYYSGILPSLGMAAGPEFILPLAALGGIVGYEAGKSEKKGLEEVIQ